MATGDGLRSRHGLFVQPSGDDLIVLLLIVHGDFIRGGGHQHGKPEQLGSHWRFRKHHDLELRGQRFRHLERDVKQLRRELG
jgi:hypothetical protein